MAAAGVPPPHGETQPYLRTCSAARGHTILKGWRADLLRASVLARGRPSVSVLRHETCKKKKEEEGALAGCLECRGRSFVALAFFAPTLENLRRS